MAAVPSARPAAVVANSRREIGLVMIGSLLEEGKVRCMTVYAERPAKTSRSIRRLPIKIIELSLGRNRGAARTCVNRLATSLRRARSARGAYATPLAGGSRLNISALADA